MIALTDQRFLYMEADFLFHTYNDLALSAIEGVQLVPTPFLSAVTVKTRAGDYTLNGVAPQLALDVVHAIENRNNV